METAIATFVVAMGIPSAVCGLLVWWLKRHIDKREALKKAHDDKVETLILMMMQENRANYILIEATARAVQRIPDAHCNGDMHSALDEARKIQNEAKDFLMQNGIERIFES